MRLLFLCHRIPYPPDKGDKIRSYHELAWLAERHEVDLFTLIDDPADHAHVDALRKLVHELVVVPLRRVGARLRAVLALVTGQSLSVAHFAEPRLRALLRERARERGYDAAFVFSSNMAPLVSDLGIPLALDFVDVDSAKFAAYATRGNPLARLLYSIEAKRLQAVERRLAESAALTLLCTEREAEELRTFARPRRLEVVPNGTDTEYFRPGDETADPRTTVVFTGAMDYRANVDAACWFADVVWPRIRARVPQATLTIVGSNPAPSVVALGTQDGIKVTGRVPDVRPYLRGARVAIAPLRVARGIQNKVLEALACGVPVVATSAALGGLRGSAGGVLVADAPEAFADAVLEVVASDARRDELASRGRAYVVAEHRWSRSLERLESLVAEAASTQVAETATSRAKAASSNVAGTSEERGADGRRT